MFGLGLKSEILRGQCQRVLTVIRKIIELAKWKYVLLHKMTSSVIEYPMQPSLLSLTNRSAALLVEPDSVGKQNVS